MRVKQEGHIRQTCVNHKCVMTLLHHSPSEAVYQMKEVKALSPLMGLANLRAAAMIAF